jgi:hypothetical protein
MSGQQASFAALSYRMVEGLLGTGKRPVGFYKSATREELGGTRWWIIAWLVECWINLSDE